MRNSNGRPWGWHNAPSQASDQLVFNEKHNELIFVKKHIE